ncbi:MAG: cytochrome o ubiquinol oxidase subunit III [Candidatus Dasytiphilus stammeri]
MSIKINHLLHITDSKKIFGFWIYLMSDCILFASLFATYAVMMNGTANGPIGREIFSLPLVLTETAFLLFSSVTYGMAMVVLQKSDDNNPYEVLIWLLLTFILGWIFVGMEFYEFHNLVIENCGPNRSGFLSGFFTLVGTHGIHVIAGLIWMIVLMSQIIIKKGITGDVRTKMVCLSLFWHFLDVIWICVFTIVYLLGVL